MIVYHSIPVLRGVKYEKDSKKKPRAERNILYIRIFFSQFAKRSATRCSDIFQECLEKEEIFRGTREGNLWNVLQDL